MDIAIVGAGHIGAGLARAWARHGHRITFAARDPEAPELLALARELGAQALPVREAVARAPVVVLAMPFGAVDALAPAADWAGRIVIDCTNPIGPGMSLQVSGNDSGAESVARRLVGARVVKSFNAQGAENLADPVYDGVPAHNFYCGDDTEAKQVAHALIAEVGFEPLDVGGLRMARQLESLTLLWFAASRAMGSRALGFRVLARSGGR